MYPCLEGAITIIWDRMAEDNVQVLGSGLRLTWIWIPTLSFISCVWSLDTLLSYSVFCLQKIEAKISIPQRAIRQRQGDMQTMEETQSDILMGLTLGLRQLCRERIFFLKYSTGEGTVPKKSRRVVWTSHRIQQWGLIGCQGPVSYLM